MARRALQTFLTLLGGVAVVAGGATVLFGVYSVPDHGGVVASVDSELRFYAVWYVAAGLAILRAATTLEAAATTIRVVAAAFFVAGCARILSLVVVGRPHATQLVLMGIELALPLVIVPWHARVVGPRR